MQAKKITVVGAGWAGLATAILLRQRGFAVTLLEAAALPGGRARGLLKAPEQDNGQHLFLGAYDHFWKIFQSIGGNISASFQQLPLTIHYLDADFTWQSRGLWPFSLISPCFENKKPWRTIKALSRLIHDKSLQYADVSVDAWLEACQLPLPLQDFLLKPLTLAALNTPTERASALILQKVLRKAFAKPGASDFFIPRYPLQEIFPNLAMSWLSKSGVIYQQDRLLELSVKAGRLQKLIFKKQGEVEVSQAVLALPPLVLASLLQKHLPELADNLKTLAFESTATCYFSLPDAASFDNFLTQPIYALWKGQKDGAQWLFYHKNHQQIAAVSSAPTAASVETLAKNVQQQLQIFFPQGLQLTHCIIEKRATFSCRVGSDRLRPVAMTPIAGLYLAGDAVATGLPATIESAIKSAFLAVAAICQATPFKPLSIKTYPTQ